METFKMLINGKLVDAASGKTYPVVNPATGEVIGKAPLGDKTEVDNAVAAALEAFPAWSKKSVDERSKLLFKFAEAVEQHADEFAEIEIADHGWPKYIIKHLVMGCVERMKANAYNARVLMSDVIPTREITLSYMRREPIGICGIIIPWNFPLQMVTGKVSGAIVTGNTCVLKPPTIDPMPALKIAEILTGLDIPPGVVNIISGPGGTMGETLASHPDVDMVSFTGSSEVGKRIMEIASRSVKRLTLELGGKNPFIVFDDADQKKASDSVVNSVTFNCAQVCAAPGRYYFHAKIYDELVDKVVEGLKKVVVGDPTKPETRMGPVASVEQRDRVEKLIKAGLDEGARLLLGGERPTTPPLDKGYFVMPTILTHVKHNSTLAREEIFGPVACIMEPFNSEEEVLKLANDNRYGLYGSVWTQDLAKGIRMVHGLRTGTARINGHQPALGLPWGGYRQSGFGKENGMMGLEEYTQSKAVMVELT